jgi:hypothetical protein
MLLKMIGNVMPNRINYLFSFLILFFSNSLIKADSDFDVSNKVSKTHERLPQHVNQASDSSFDKRLPPVLPGELMNDSGKTMKVWSSAGAVPVEPLRTDCINAQNQTNCPNQIDPNKVGVILDRRNP